MLKDASILLIEEDKNSSLFYKKVLARLNIDRVTVINNLFDIQPTIKQLNPDLIIIDVIGKDESRALKILEMLETFENKIPFIIVSNTLNLDINRKLRNNFRADSFIKPLDVIQFAGSIYKLLDDLSKVYT